MSQGATPENMEMIRDIFEFNRDEEQISRIRTSVNDFEKLTRQQAEKRARAILDHAKSLRLHQQADSIRKNIIPYANRKQ